MPRRLFLFTGLYALIVVVAFSLWASHGQAKENRERSTVTVVDQSGRTVAVPARVERVAAFYHMAGKIVFALGQQHKLVSQSLLRNEGEAMARVDPTFAAKPLLMGGDTLNLETLMTLRPDVVFVYASLDKTDETEMERIEKTGVKVVAIKGETFEEGFEAVRLIAKVLNCKDRGEAYIEECNRLLNLVAKQVLNVRQDKRPKVLFLGPKGSYDVAGGEMIQTIILRKAGAENVASGLKGRWPVVSPEQIVAWNPDVIFVGSGWGGFVAARLLDNPQLKVVKAVRDRKVFDFPSNIGWWDFPAPHCVLGIVWVAKTLYPERFKDLSIQAVADDYYKKYLGYSFTSLGGKLTP